MDDSQGNSINPAEAEGSPGMSFDYPTMDESPPVATPRVPTERDAKYASLDYSSLRSQESSPPAEPSEPGHAPVPLDPGQYGFLQSVGENNTEQANAFATMAHEKGLSDTQVQSLYEWGQEAGLVPLSYEEASDALRSELGDEAEAMASAAAGLVQEVCDDADIRWLEQSGMGNSPALIRLIGKIARQE